jgi:hypothetical protein
VRHWLLLQASVVHFGGKIWRFPTLHQPSLSPAG